MLTQLLSYLLDVAASDQPSTLTCLHTCVLTNLLAYSIEYLPTYLVAYICIRLPVCLDTHMLTREHPTLYKYLLACYLLTQLLACSITYMVTPGAPAPNTYIPKNLLTC